MINKNIKKSLGGKYRKRIGIFVFGIFLLTGTIYSSNTVFANENTTNGTESSTSTNGTTTNSVKKSNEVLYKFFPKIEDDNMIVSIEPGEKFSDFNVGIVNSQFSNLSRFKQLIIELWKKQPDGNITNTDNFLLNRTNDLTDFGIVGESVNNIDMLTTYMSNGNKYNEYILFNKLALPFYDGNGELKNNYFDIPYEELLLKHKDKKPIKIISKNFSSIGEILFTLSQPSSDNYFTDTTGDCGEEGCVRYAVSFLTKNIGTGLQKVLKNKDFKKIYIRDSEHNEYKFIVTNYWKFGLNYDNMTQADGNQYYNGNNTNPIPKATNKTFKKSFKKYKGIVKDKGLMNIDGYYYFAEDGATSPTVNDLRAIGNACRDKGGRLYYGLVDEMNAILGTMFNENSLLKSYGIFKVRLCKKENPLFERINFFIEIPKSRFTADKKVSLFLGVNNKPGFINEKMKKHKYQLKGRDFTANENSISFIKNPSEELIYDETSPSFKLAIFGDENSIQTPNINDMVLLNIKDNNIYYRKYNTEIANYEKGIRVPLDSPLKENILIQSSPNADYQMFSKKEERRYKFPLSMEKYPYGEYILKITPVYEPKYFVNFKEVNKCFPDLLNINSGLVNRYIKKNGKKVEINVKNMENFQKEFFEKILSLELFPDIFLFEEKINLGCEKVNENQELKNILKKHLGLIGADIPSLKNDSKQACYFLANNGRYLGNENPIKEESPLYNITEGNLKSIKLETTPKNQNCSGNSVDSCETNIDSGTKLLVVKNGQKKERYIYNTKITYLCNTKDGVLNNFQAYKIYGLNNIIGNSEVVYPNSSKSFRWFWDY